MMKNLCISLAALMFAASSLFATSPARAQSWPQHTVRLIVPLPAGSGPDLAARLLAERLTPRWGQPVVVENRPGSDGIIAATSYLAVHDDHALLFSFGGVVSINPLVYDKLPYDPAELAPICVVTDFFLALAASPAIKVNTLDDLVKLARAQPGKLNWASSPGLPRYVFTTLLNETRLDMVEVSYRDFNQGALPDLRQGRIHAVATGLPSVLPLVQAGGAKLLLLPNRERSALAPDVPTAKEAGHPELTFDAVIGLFGQRDLPADLKARIAADVRAAAADPAVNARLLTVGAAVRFGDADEFAALIEEQRRKVAAIQQPGGKPPQ